jgi:hypothetical protein
MRFGIQATVFCAFDEVMASRGQDVDACDASTFAPVLIKCTALMLSAEAQPVHEWVAYPEGLVCPACDVMLKQGGKGICA